MAERCGAVQPRMAWALRALTLGLLACGPVKDDGDGSASAEGTSADATSASVGSGESITSTSTTSGASVDASSTGAPIACPDNVANEPFCYRKFAIPSNGELGPLPTGGQRAQPVGAGHFGPDGELAFLLAGQDAGMPMALAFWNGDGFDVQPWGVVPGFEYPHTRWPVRMFDGVHSDLAVGRSDQPSYALAIAPWTPDGPGEPVVVEPPSPDYIITLFRAQTVLDVNGDGLEEIAVLVQPFVHRLVGNVDGVPSFFGDELTHDGKCGREILGIGAGQIDGDGLVDIASIAACELRNLGGVLAFSAEWGDGAGGFASEGVTFSATSRPAWAGVADFDGDGFDDVMTATEDNSKYYESYLDFHRSRGDRTFEAPLKFWTELDPPGSFIPPPIPPSAATLGLVFGDVDGDGADDVVFQGFMLAVVQVAGETQYLEMFDIALDEDSTQMVSAFDLNEDGRLDFLVWDATEGAYALMSSA